MTTDSDINHQLAAQVAEAYNRKQAVVISAGNSKLFYGRNISAEKLSTTGHHGILSYRASELVLTARSGTRIKDIENELAANQQMLAFEPPCHSEATTLGGSIACALSGPRRPYCGAARDFVLGAKIINGKGEILKFGGQVMKNVAGYDASRLMVGAQGTLGVLLDISIKVLPKPESDITLAFETTFDTAQTNFRDWVQQGLPLSASCYIQGMAYIRLSSTDSSVKQSHKNLGGEISDTSIWEQLQHQTHEFFNNKNLWRLSLPPATEEIMSHRPQLIEWGGALRWISLEDNHNDDMFSLAKKYDGHATHYALNSNSSETIFQPLPPGLLTLHQRLKKSFDPENILNPGRLYKHL